MRLLADDIGNVMTGTNKDETGWVDVASYAAGILNQEGNVVFMTPSERAQLTNDQVEVLKQSEKELIMVTDAVFGKISGMVETFATVSDKYRENYKYNFIQYKNLTFDERETFDLTTPIMELISKKYSKDAPNIKISETIRIDDLGLVTQGAWDSAENAIIIKRSVLKSKETFAGVLMHEFAHYVSGYTDNTRGFENVLTEMLGFVYNELSVKEEKPKMFGLFKRR